MVSRKVKLNVTQYICDILEYSGLYNIINKDHEQVRFIEKDDVRDIPLKVNVLIPNFMDSPQAFSNRFYNNRVQEVFTAPVHYKDGKTAFVRMVERNPSWRSDKSLKEYSPYDINRMIHLRKIEKIIMKNFGNSLIYFQPETERLEEGLKEFKLERVGLNYDHICPGHPSYGFVTNRDSVDYKLPESLGIIEPVEVGYFNQFRAKLIKG